MIYLFDQFELREKDFCLYENGKRIALEPKALRVLLLLLSRAGHLVEKGFLLETVWSNTFVEENTLTRTILVLRRALGDDRRDRIFIETVPTKGYRFIHEFRQVPEEQDLSPSSGDRLIEPVEEVNRAGSQEENRLIPAANGSGAASPGAFTIQEPAPIDAGNPGEEQRLHRLAWPRLLTLAALGLFVLAIVLSAAARRDRSPDRSAKSKITSLAVLPLDNLSGDPSQNYFADGMTDELTAMLAKNSTLRVVSRTSVMQYKGVHRPLPDIASELGVDGILEGSITRSADKVHMTIQLIQAPSDTHIWAETYDRDANDVVSLPREAALTIAKTLNSATPRPAAQRYVNAEAQDAYMRGRYLWFAFKNEEAGKYFRRVTELQPDYAPGWAGLANYYNVSALDHLMRPEDSLQPALAMASRAIELDDSLPEAHLAMGTSIFLAQWDWARADREISRAIELDPTFAEAYFFRSQMYAMFNRKDEAIAAARKSMELNPFARTYAVANVYCDLREYDAAIKEARLQLEAQPEESFLHWVLYKSYRAKGADKEAAYELEKMLQLVGFPSAAASVKREFERGGTTAMNRWRLYDLKRQTKYIPPMDKASYAAELGLRDEALSLIEEAYQHHSPDVIWIRTDPAYDYLHSDERYQTIINLMKFPAAN